MSQPSQHLARDPAKLANLVIDMAAREVGGPHRAFRALYARLRGLWRNSGAAIPHSAAKALDREARIRIVALLCEGRSLDEAARLDGTSVEAVGALIRDAGRAAAWYQERVLRHLASRRIRIEAIATFADDAWTWIAVDAQDGLIPCWRVGARDGETAIAFVSEVADRFDHPLKLVSDRNSAWLDALEGDADCDIDVAILRSLFGEHPQAKARSEEPSQAIEDHARAVALFAMHHNFIRIHKVSRTAPAVAAGVIEKPWQFSNIVDVLEMHQQLKTGPWYERLVVLKGG